MSERIPTNGDINPPISIDNVHLAARIELCLKRLTEVTEHLEALGTEITAIRVDTGVIRAWIEKLRLNAKDSGGLLKRVANDQLEIRTGIPARWGQRFALVIAGGVLGTILGSLLVIFVAAAIKRWL